MGAERFARGGDRGKAMAVELARWALALKELEAQL
jgi:hypothetical protein